MIPLIGTQREFDVLQAKIVREVADEVFAQRPGLRHRLSDVGTMIELPRAALTAADIAGTAEFFSFGTNDLTQTTFGISRDDAGKFLPRVRSSSTSSTDDPFASLDIGRGRAPDASIAKIDATAARPASDIKLGICGEHGGDPRSIRVLSGAGPGLRLLFALPHPDRTARGGAGGARSAALRAAASERVFRTYPSVFGLDFGLRP